MVLALSDQQQHVLDWVEFGKGNAFVEAVAGSGKTFTLVQIAPYLKGRAAYCVFNRANANEAKIKLNHIGGLDVNTFHSFGFKAWRPFTTNVEVNAWEKRKLMMESVEVPKNLQAAVHKMVSVGKQSFFGTDTPNQWDYVIQHHDILFKIEGSTTGESRGDTVRRLSTFADEGLAWSRSVGDRIIDFDDMIWLPLIEGVPFPQYDWVMVDEAQDTNYVRRLIASRMLDDNGRCIWVGDRHQAIYGFTGADSNAVDLIVKDFECQMMPLSTTYRCSKEATKLAQTLVPHIEAHEDNRDGSVTMSHNFWQDYVRQDPEESGEEVERPDRIGPGDAVLCRMNRPLVDLAFRLIREGVGCHVEGRDIGKSLTSMIDKFDTDGTVHRMTAVMESYRKNEIKRLREQDGSEAQIASLMDKIATIRILCEGCEDVGKVKARIEHLFQDTNGKPRNTVTLSTVHKAKGREWDRVFILGYEEYMPSNWATQEWELEQEHNIIYVAVTRTKNDLVLLPAMEEE